MKKYIAEFFGTFAMIFCGTGAIIINQETGGLVTHLGISITFGLIVMAMIHSLRTISGAHLNPAVTIAFAFAKKLDTKQILPYIFSQFIGGIIASRLLRFLFPKNEMLGATMPLKSDLQEFILEFAISFILMFVILNVANGAKEQSLLAGITIGSTVLILALFAGPICGASMNPARSMGLALISGHFEHLWIYLIAPVLGTCSSVFLWNYIIKKD